jgi:hypothetical protein
MFRNLARRFADGLSCFASSQSSLSRPEASIPREPNTIDLSARTWGCNHSTLGIIDGGQRLRLAIWSPRMPEQGDYLILGTSDGTTRYRVDGIECCGNPRDMALVDATFAPRKAA